MTNQYKYETYGTTMVLEGDVSHAEHVAIHQRYTQALAESMRSTREHLMADLLSEKNWVQEVDFD